MTKSYDLAIRSSDNKSVITRVIKAGGVSVYGNPGYLRRGRWVALITKGNRISLMFKVASIEGPLKGRSANGEIRDSRYFIKADKRSIQQPEFLILQSVRGWFSIVRVITFLTMEAVIVGDTPSPPQTGIYIPNDTSKVSGTVF